MSDSLSQFDKSNATEAVMRVKFVGKLIFDDGVRVIEGTMSADEILAALGTVTMPSSTESTCEGCRRSLPFNKFGHHFELIPKTGTMRYTAKASMPSATALLPGWVQVPAEPPGAILGFIAGEYQGDRPHLTRDQARTVWNAILAQARTLMIHAPNAQSDKAKLDAAVQDLAEGWSKGKP